MVKMMSSKLLTWVMIVWIDKFGEATAQFPYTNYGNQSRGNSRDIFHATGLQRDRSGGSQSSTDLPVTFKAPDIQSQNFWNGNLQNSANRRTFLDDFGYLNYGKTNVFPKVNSFFDLMSPLFEAGSLFKPTQPTVTKTVSEPYKYEYPYKLRSSTEMNYHLPPPKPIRASIVKLEAITRPPVLPLPINYATTPKYIPHYSDFVPGAVQRPNSFHIDELGFHTNYNINFKGEPSRTSQQVPMEGTFLKYETSGNRNPSILKSASGEGTNFGLTTLPALQEQPPNHGGLENVHNYTNFAQIMMNAKNVEENSKEFPTTESGAAEADSNADPREINNTKEAIGPEEKFNDKGTDLFIRSIVVRQKNNSNAKGGDETGDGKNGRPYRTGNSIKIVTDLTLEGLLKNNKQTANIPSYTKFLNMSSLIKYELNKLRQNKTLSPRLDIESEKSTSPTHFNGEDHLFATTNTYDDLSLDLKILKDTNWDGFTSELSEMTTTPPTREDVIQSNSRESEDGDTKPITVNRTDFLSHSNFENVTNNAQINASSEHHEKHNNKTIIIETRVTKSITKASSSVRVPKGKTVSTTNRSRGLYPRRTIQILAKHVDATPTNAPEALDATARIVAVKMRASEAEENHAVDVEKATPKDNEPATPTNFNNSNKSELNDNDFGELNLTGRLQSNDLKRLNYADSADTLFSTAAYSENAKSTTEKEKSVDPNKDNVDTNVTQRGNRNFKLSFGARQQTTVTNKTKNSGAIRDALKRKPKSRKSKRRRNGKRRGNTNAAEGPSHEQPLTQQNTS